MSAFDNEKKKSADNQRFLEFHLGAESYAVELLVVKEVITPPEMTPIPKSPAYVCGLMNLRGLVMTVIDLRKKLNINPGTDKSQNAVIIFDLGERRVGVVVDSIQKVLNVSSDAIKDVPDEEGHSTQHFKGIIQQENKLTMWIDPQSLLDKTITSLKAA